MEDKTSTANVMSTGISCEIEVTVDKKETFALPILNQRIEPDTVRKN